MYLSLPPGAVNPSHEVLWVDIEDRLHIRHVDILRSETDRVLIKGDLNPGDRVVVSGIQVPVQGMKIRTNRSLHARAGSGKCAKGYINASTSTVIPFFSPCYVPAPSLCKETPR